MEAEPERRTFWSWDLGPKAERERQQGLSSWAVPPSALGFRKFPRAGEALAWEPGDQRQGCGCSGPSKDGEACLGLVNRRCWKVVAERNPRDGSEGRVQNRARVPGTGGEWRAVGIGVDDTAALDMVSVSLGVMPRRLLKTKSGAF